MSTAHGLDLAPGFKVYLEPVGGRHQMRIGELAALAGVPTPTVRYYERRGLIIESARTRAGYRQYGPEAVRRLRFIRHAQELGFALDEIEEMLALRIDDPAACARVEATTRAKVRVVQQRLAELQRLERALTELVHSCEHQRPAEPCPILTILSRDDSGVRTADSNAHA